MLRRRFKARGDGSRYGKRHKPGVMNGTDSKYAETLEALRLEGNVVAWHFEAVTFKLAEALRYTPDFMVEYCDGVIEFVDAKGGGPIDDKSVAKIKMAAEKFWQFQFVIEQKQSKKDGGGWKRTEY